MKEPVLIGAPKIVKFILYGQRAGIPVYVNESATRCEPIATNANLKYGVNSIGAKARAIKIAEWVNILCPSLE